MDLERPIRPFPTSRLFRGSLQRDIAPTPISADVLLAERRPTAIAVYRNRLFAGDPAALDAARACVSQGVLPTRLLDGMLYDRRAAALAVRLLPDARGDAVAALWDVVARDPDDAYEGLFDRDDAPALAIVRRAYERRERRMAGWEERPPTPMPLEGRERARLLASLGLVLAQPSPPPAVELFNVFALLDPQELEALADRVGAVSSDDLLLLRSRQRAHAARDRLAAADDKLSAFEALSLDLRGVDAADDDTLEALARTSATWAGLALVELARRDWSRARRVPRSEDHDSGIEVLLDRFETAAAMRAELADCGFPSVRCQPDAAVWPHELLRLAGYAVGSTCWYPVEPWMEVELQLALDALVPGAFAHTIVMAGRETACRLK